MKFTSSGKTHFALKTGFNPFAVNSEQKFIKCLNLTLSEVRKSYSRWSWLVTNSIASDLEAEKLIAVLTLRLYSWKHLVRTKPCLSYEYLLDVIKTHQVNADIPP
jgi:hypothetical protein